MYQDFTGPSVYPNPTGNPKSATSYIIIKLEIRRYFSSQALWNLKMITMALKSLQILTTVILKQLLVYYPNCF